MFLLCGGGIVSFLEMSRLENACCTLGVSSGVMRGMPEFARSGMMANPSSDSMGIPFMSNAISGCIIMSGRPIESKPIGICSWLQSSMNCGLDSSDMDLLPWAKSSKPESGVEVRKPLVGVGGESIWGPGGVGPLVGRSKYGAGGPSTAGLSSDSGGGGMFRDEVLGLPELLSCGDAGLMWTGLCWIGLPPFAGGATFSAAIVWSGGRCP